MQAIVRWVGYAVVAAALLALTAVALIWTGSEWHLRSFPRPPAFALAIPAYAETIAHGQHLVNTRGCSSCHGEKLEGQVIFGSAVAPNLAALARKESPAAIEAALRHGIGHDGRALYSMPSFSFVRLTDGDVAAIVAFLRTAPVVENKLPPPMLPLEIRMALALGMDKAIPGFLDKVAPLRHATGGDTQIARGEYIAMTTCIECHGFSLRADFPWPQDEKPPDLSIVIGAYERADFGTLMKTGKGLNNRELRLMSGTARKRFSQFTEQEVDDLYTYLRSMPPTQQ